MDENLTRMLHNAVLSGPMPAKALAHEIGKPYSTLMRELNPYDTGAKLGVDTMFAILKHTRDITPLEYMANHLGFSLSHSDIVTIDTDPRYILRRLPFN